MKKIVSLLLIVSLLIACVATLASCSDGISAKDLENNAGEVLGNAAQQSFSTFFAGGNTGIGSVLEKTADKGKYTILLNSDSLFGELTEIKEVIYVDNKNDAFVSDTGVVYGGETLSAMVYGKNNTVAISGQSIFGDATALLINPKTLSTKLSGSEIAKLLDMDANTASEVGLFINNMVNTGMLDLGSYGEKFAKLYNDILSKMDKKITTEKIDNVDCLVTTYTLDNDAFKDIIDVVYAFASENMVVMSSSEAADEATAETKAELRQMLNELVASVDVDMEIKMAIDSKTSALYSVKVKGDLKVETTYTDYEYDVNADGDKIEKEVIKTSTETFDIDATLIITDAKIALDIDMTADEEDVSLAAELTKKITDGDVKYELKITGDAEAGSLNILTASCEHKKNGDLTVEIAIPQGLGGAVTKATFKGSLKAENDKLELIVNSIKVGTQEIDLELTVIAETVDKLPEFPANAKDIVDLSAEECQTIMQKVMESDLATLIAALVPENPGPTVNPNVPSGGPTVDPNIGSNNNDYNNAGDGIEGEKDLTMGDTNGDGFEENDFGVGVSTAAPAPTSEQTRPAN